MCYTWRHDFGLPADPDFPGMGMTESDREFLWRQMAQIFDNDIAPNMELKREHRKAIKQQAREEKRAQRAASNYSRVGADAMIRGK
jgi:hypothetical protein